MKQKLKCFQTKSIGCFYNSYHVLKSDLLVISQYFFYFLYRNSDSKSKKQRKKRHSLESGEEEGAVGIAVKPLVEYSDVSSEELSSPEAGEIQSEGTPPFDDSDQDSSMSRHQNHHHRYVTFDTS